MCKIIIENCIKHVANKFELVLIASKRARNIAMGKVNPLIEPYDDKPTVVALREMEAGYDMKVLNDRKT